MDRIAGMAPDSTNPFGWHRIDVRTWALGTLTADGVQNILAEVVWRNGTWTYNAGGVIGEAGSSETAMAKADSAVNVWMTLTKTPR